MSRLDDETTTTGGKVTNRVKEGKELEEKEEEEEEKERRMENQMTDKEFTTIADSSRGKWRC